MFHTRQHLLRGLFALALLTAPASIHAQTVDTPVAGTELRSTKSVVVLDDCHLAGRAIAALERLRTDVVFYRSLAEFESDGRLAQVSFETFKRKLDEVTAEIEPVLSQLHDSKVKNNLTNTLQSYRDGAFWWSKLDQSKVVTIAKLGASFTTISPAERFFTSTVPYNVAIEWRLADRYLQRVQKLMAERAIASSRDTPSSLSVRVFNR